MRPALEAARAICGVPQVHAAGYCLGGTALAMLLAWLTADPADRAANPIAHWSTFTTLVDFSDPGEIGAFLSEASFDFLRRRMAETAIWTEPTWRGAFRLLRPNSLIWHYVIHSYLYGEELPPSDVLFWNCDTTRMPAAMHEFYLRELYLNNRLMRPSAWKSADGDSIWARLRNRSTPWARNRIISRPGSRPSGCAG